jgi:hypothetical protein
MPKYFGLDDLGWLARGGRHVLCTAAAVGAVLAPLSAHAAGTITFGPNNDESISIGLGLRGSVTSDARGNATGGQSTDFNLDSIRLYVNGQLTKQIGATLNTERDGDGDIEVLDGYARFEFRDEINVWVGRMLPPSDRSNLDGPYYLSSYNYPGGVSQYPSKFDGRDDGVTVWGKLLAKKLTYAVGVFNGHDRVAGAANQAHNPLVAARVAYNFWDVEDNPGYYTSSTYYGTANVLTLAFAGMSQKDGVGSLTGHGDYESWNVDGLMERKVLDGGAVTLEGAYYHYDTGGVTDVASNFGGAGPNDNIGGLTQGNAYLVSAGFLFPQVVGIGKFQPVVRYQQFDATITHVTTRQTDASLNYIIKGHNARLSLDWAHEEATYAPNDDRVTAGVQLQF